MDTKTGFAARLGSATAALALTFVGINAQAESAAPVIAATPILRVPFVINKPGLYVLKKNLAYNGTTTAITISANDVTVDLGGHTLSSGAPQDETNTSMGVRAEEKQDITIRNGVLRNFYQGVNLNQTKNSGRVLVEGLTVTNSGYVGIDVSHALDIEVRDCHVLETGYQSSIYGTCGIHVFGDNVKIVSNVVGNIRQHGSLEGEGIRTEVTDSARVEQNNVSAVELAARGIACLGPASFAVQNTISHFDEGVHVLTGIYQGNLTSGCTTPFAGGTDGGGNK